MSWSSNALHPEDLDEDGSFEPRARKTQQRSHTEIHDADRFGADLTLDVTGDVMPSALHPATLVRRKALPNHRPHHKPLASSRLRTPQTLTRVSEDAERLLEDYLETGRVIQARRLTMSLARALEADLGHWEWSVPERADCLSGLAGHLEHLQSLCQPLLACLVTGGAWADGDFSLCCTAPLDYLANPVSIDAYSTRKGLLPWLRHYPIVYLAYGVGIAAAAGKRYATLSRLFHDIAMPNPFGLDRSPLSIGLFAWSGKEQEFIRQLPEMPGNGSLTDQLYLTLEQSLRELIGRPALYDAAFDRFTLLLACAYADEVLTSGQPLTWVPQERITGSVLTSGTATRMEAEARKEGDSWPPLRAGLFQGSIDRFLELLHRVEVLRGNRLDDFGKDAHS